MNADILRLTALIDARTAHWLGGYEYSNRTKASILITAPYWNASSPEAIVAFTRPIMNLRCHLNNAESAPSVPHQYRQIDMLRWLGTHLLLYAPLLAGAILTRIAVNAIYPLIPILTGSAFQLVLRRSADRDHLLALAAAVLGIGVAGGLIDLVGSFFAVMLSKSLQRDVRDEICLNILGKSQTFHARQRVGDLMARATNDVAILSDMIFPACDSLTYAFFNMILVLVYIGFLRPILLPIPLLLVAIAAVSLHQYAQRLRPVAQQMRESYGTLTAELTERVDGIDVVKSSAQEGQVLFELKAIACRNRDLYLQNGRVQARFLPPLLLALAMTAAFIQGMILIAQHQLSIGTLIAYMGLMALLSYPTSVSIWTFDSIQTGLAAIERILTVLRDEVEIDPNHSGCHAEIRGEIVFDDVTFSYADEGTSVLRQVSFHVSPGETVAIIGQTGAGKSTLLGLVNRTYDVTSGRILVDGIDVRDWNLAALRSQMATIEQDAFLFSRSIADNIAFGVDGEVDRSSIEHAAMEAQAHDFIMRFPAGYETVIGERGLTLSGGQRQRLAIARALLTNPRILLVDDATSAVDGATEDAIQHAMWRVARGRTTLVVSHRLAQIRTADRILVLEQGSITDQGTHEELLARCRAYRRIFAQYARAQPPL